MFRKGIGIGKRSYNAIGCNSMLVDLQCDMKYIIIGVFRAETASIRDEEDLFRTELFQSRKPTFDTVESHIILVRFESKTDAEKIRHIFFYC